MSAVATGLWHDKSQNLVLGATLTLSIQQANLLLTALAFLVTLTAGSFWNIFAMVLHSRLVKGKISHVLGLQHQVVLRNSGTAVATMVNAVMIHLAWRERGAPKLWTRTLGTFLPALLVWCVFAAASIFTSRVALSSQSGATIALLEPNNCGFFTYNISDLNAAVAQINKMTNDTLQARNYVNTYYNNATISPTGSNFKSILLPYSVDTSAACPFPNATRCKVGPSSAMAMTSGFLDSYEDFGINSSPSDRVKFQYNMTCSPIHAPDLAQEVLDDNNQTWIEIYIGPLVGAGVPYTYQYDKATANANIGYILDTIPAYVGIPYDDVLWIPLPEFNRTDADVTALFMSQNHISYLQPTSDPWFTANITQGNFTGTNDGYGLMGYAPNNDLNLMMCTEQYVMCNPVTNLCSQPAGVNQLLLALNELGFNTVQQVTALRFGIAMESSNQGISAIGPVSLWARNLLYGTLSPGLPDNQWQLEVLGWFQTNIVKLQQYFNEYASQSGDLGPYGSVHSPSDGFIPAESQVLVEQCGSQLVRTSGEVQNFSFLGIMIIVLFSIVMFMLNIFMESILGLYYKLTGKFPPQAVARQADTMLHLLRLALPSSGEGAAGWEAGSWGVPVANNLHTRPRMTEDEKLAVYEDQIVYTQPKTASGTMSYPKVQTDNIYNERDIDVDSLLLRD
ncbi:hypothetical protein BX600DRAFT_443886 [Xylariales sp. PMI_506]|nr:hypothetical protein BX600DRAFT_443886 [Xylariales sp. PMI_506]